MGASKPVRRGGPAVRPREECPDESGHSRPKARATVAVAVCLVIIASVRIVATYSELSVTFDEPGHFACGLEYLSKHVYRYESQHPPLARAMMALGPYLDGTRLRGGADRDREGVDVLSASPNPDRTVGLMRAGILPFFWLAALAVYLWARREFGGAAAALAVAMFTLTPPVLAHAGLATTDMALAACVTLAFYALLVWAKSPGWKESVVLGVATAAAVLAKFTALGYLPCATLFALLLWVAIERPGLAELVAQAKAHASGAAIAAGCCAVAIWAAYWFSFAGVPAPEFFDGIRVAVSHNQTGHDSYLLGKTSTMGWWYFFPVALAVKTPIALLLLAVIGLAACWRRNFAIPAFCLGILAPAMASHINIGVRHVLPIYCGICILGAAGLVRLVEWAGSGRAALAIAGVLLTWMAAGGVAAHPDYLTYFNEFASAHPDDVLVDSDLDWGQESKRLGRRMQQLGVTELHANFYDRYVHPALDHLPPVKPLDPFTASPGWNAVSATAAKHASLAPTLTGTSAANLEQARSQTTPWYETMDPTERVGALRLYKIPARP